jgi:RNA polymerase-interacting CarD/CdnL/TRCF family regulator
MTVTGKVQKYLMREQMERELGAWERRLLEFALALARCSD